MLHKHTDGSSKAVGIVQGILVDIHDGERANNVHGDEGEGEDCASQHDLPKQACSLHMHRQDKSIRK